MEVSEYKHKAPLPDAVVKAIEPIYEDLSDVSLLSRCLDGYTQNAAESFNNMVWVRCPKERFCGNEFLNLAVDGARMGAKKRLKE